MSDNLIELRKLAGSERKGIATPETIILANDHVTNYAVLFSLPVLIFLERPGLRYFFAVKIGKDV